MTRGQVNLGGRMLRWVEYGNGAPTVVLIAGRNDTALTWGPVLAALGAEPARWLTTAPGWATVTPIGKPLLPNGPWLTCPG